MDVVSNLFINLLEGLGLVDINPLVSIPTWSNRRVGSKSICKRLDRLLLSVDFFNGNFFLKQWIGCGGDCDHCCNLIDHIRLPIIHSKTYINIEQRQETRTDRF